MRIAIFTDTYYPQLNGVATSVMMLTRNLRAMGHRVFVFTTTDPEAPPIEEDVFRLPSLPVLKDRRMGMFYHPKLARMVKNLHLDVIHTHTEFCVGVFGRHLARSLDIPMLHTMHTIYEEYTHYLTKRKALDAMAKKVARRIIADFCAYADRIVTPSAKAKDLLLSYGVRVGIDIIPSGIELDRFAPGYYSPGEIQAARDEIGLSAGDKVLLYIGRIAKEKYLDELILYLRQYLRDTDNVKLLLIGDGLVRQKLEKLVASLDIEDKTIFAGARPWADIGKYYQIGDIFVNASRSESQGLTYIEAMAAGVPVVAKADPCLEGVLIDGVSGFAYNDNDEMINIIDRLLSDDQERERLAKGALSIASRFSVATYAAAILEEYESLTERPGASKISL